MQLSISQLLPEYFADERKQSSQVWGKDIIFENHRLIKIVAPSGSGKSSLMNFLYGMRSNYTGKVLYDNNELKTVMPEKLGTYRAGNMSIVFQDLKLLPGQTLMQNLMIKWQLQPYAGQEVITDMACRLGIGKQLQQPAGNCSYGEQQRAAVIRALLQPFQYLLLDEPFSHLDDANAGKALQLILEEADKRKATVIYADLEKNTAYPFHQLYYL